MDRQDPSPLKPAFTILGVLASQAAVLVPILYYFGSRYTGSWYGYFGIDLSLLGLSTIDLLSRSVSPTLWPVILVLVVVLALLAARRLPIALARRTRNERRALRIWYLFTLGTGIGAIALPPLVRLTPLLAWARLGPYLLPGALVIGSVLLTYATTLYASNPGLWPSPGETTETTRTTAVAITVALFILGMAGTVWGVGAYAVARGIDDAKTVARHGFPGQPSILIFSVDRLGIEGTGTQVDELEVPGERYRYYYSGLRLLGRTADAYLVIPQEWQARRDRVFVVPHSDSIRIDISTTRND